MRVAIYARMSTDKQNEQSPADQIAECRRFAEARGWEVLEPLVAAEAGVSGATRHNRPKLLELVERMGEWEVLLCWESSRLARNQEDLGWIINRLRAKKRTGYEVSTGLELLNVGARVMGVFAEEYLHKLREDTRRGLRRRAEAGLSAGGLAYGYRTEPVAVDEQGRPVEAAGRRIAIDEGQAQVVRRLFELYLRGAGLREIAHHLNGEGVPPPRPRALRGRPASWAPTAIREMLRNPIYRGERIFNRSEWVKDHETGRRRRFERPPAEWVREDRPDLAIVPAESFEAAQAETRRRVAHYRWRPGPHPLRGEFPGRGHPRQARHVLSGFLECGLCGGGFHALNGAERYGCAWHRGRGPVVCASALTVRRAALEERIFGAIRDRILVPEVVAYAVEKALSLVEARLRRDARGPSAAERARLAEIEDELATLRRMAERGRAGQVAQLVEELEAERATLATPCAAPSRTWPPCGAWQRPACSTCGRPSRARPMRGAAPSWPSWATGACASSRTRSSASAWRGSSSWCWKRETPGPLRAPGVSCHW